MYVIDKLFDRTCLRTTIQMSTKIVLVILSKSLSLFALFLFLLTCFHSLPMGVYDATSTWFQGQQPTPSPHPAASSSSCVPLPSITTSPLRRRHDGLVKRHPSPTAAPDTNGPTGPPPS